MGRQLKPELYEEIPASDPEVRPVLSPSGQKSFTAAIQIKGESTNIKSILTQTEIKKLYQAIAAE